MGGAILADYTPAHLRIGGDITNEQSLEIQRLTDDGAEVAFGWLYEIWHDEARGGEFAALEGYLTQQEIPFDRYSAPALGYDGRLAQYRPGMSQPLEFLASGDHQERVVPLADLQSILSSYPTDGPAGEALVSQLRALCGPVVGPLPKFLVRLAEE
jgi:hypothetical protein